MKILALGTTVYIDPSQCDASTREELAGAAVGLAGFDRNLAAHHAAILRGAP